MNSWAHAWNSVPRRAWRESACGIGRYTESWIMPGVPAGEGSFPDTGASPPEPDPRLSANCSWIFVTLTMPVRSACVKPGASLRLSCGAVPPPFCCLSLISLTAARASGCPSSSSIVAPLQLSARPSTSRALPDSTSCTMLLLSAGHTAVRSTTCACADSARAPTTTASRKRPASSPTNSPTGSSQCLPAISAASSIS